MKYILVGLIIIIMIFTVSCEKPTDDELYYEINQRMSNIKSYSCLAKMTIEGNKSSKDYSARQIFIAPDKYYIEFYTPEESKGYKVVYNGNNILLSHPGINQSYLIEDYKDNNSSTDMFIGSFMGFFMTNENSEFYSEFIDEKEYLVYKTIIPGNSKYRNSQKLWIDKKSYKPYKIITYDSDDNIKVTVIFENFKFDIDINLDIFNM